MTPRPTSPTAARRGSALLISLWALLVLAAAVLAWARFIDAEVALSNTSNRGLEAKAFAHSGLAIAFHPQIKPESPLLEQLDPDGNGFRVRMIGEGGRLNINAILRQPTPARLDLLKRYLGELGMDFRDRDVLVDSLIDWVDPNALRSLNGREADGSYRPPNRGFLVSVEEMAQVHGSGPLLDIPGWREAFTIHSEGAIDLLFAPLSLLRSIPGVNERSAAAFIALRAGEDGEDGTEDDHEFKGGIDEAKSYLGIPRQSEADEFLALGGAFWRIESVGRVGDIVRSVDAVVQKQNNSPVIYSWKEK